MKFKNLMGREKKKKIFLKKLIDELNKIFFNDIKYFFLFFKKKIL
jgi:hypothetical protein